MLCIANTQYKKIGEYCDQHPTTMQSLSRNHHNIRYADLIMINNIKILKRGYYTIYKLKYQLPRMFLSITEYQLFNNHHGAAAFG